MGYVRGCIREVGLRQCCGECSIRGRRGGGGSVCSLGHSTRRGRGGSVGHGIRGGRGGSVCSLGHSTRRGREGSVGHGIGRGGGISRAWPEKARLRKVSKCHVVNERHDLLT